MRWHIEPLVLGLNPLTIELQKRCGIVWVEVCELARQIELAHYPQIREWRGNGRPTCAKCGSSWPCQRARDAVRLREILGGGDDPGDDGARDLIPEVTATRAVPKARKPGTAHEAKEAA
ncbi:hypothetical protein [Propionibacterium freudenreichii]|uniref:hypothetical protein n=1 Tax=Propionibacterium freudenreichii TaxID=1744 RepID=UPI0021A8AF97|nr:hypothetical protein [Propionibacterium freudenreichii]